jgi:hypothetical protein
VRNGSEGSEMDERKEGKKLRKKGGEDKRRE